VIPLLLTLLSIGFLILLSATYSGSETGFYCVSRMRIEADAQNGHRPSVYIRRLLKDETGLLITILIGNNLAIEMVTLQFEHYLAGLDLIGEAWLSLAVTLILTPVLFFFAELLPKDLFRRRPYALLSWTVWPVVVFYVLFWPLMFVLRLFTNGVQKLFRVQEGALLRTRGREEVFEMLEESSRSGALELRSKTMARNALSLANISVGAVMTPWKDVEHLDLGPTVAGASDPRAQVAAQEAVAKAEHSRLPVLQDGVVQGYIHQLEALGNARGGQNGLDKPREPWDFPGMLHPLDCLAPTVSVQAALGSLRRGGRRAALVGDPAAPLGLLSMKDLAERISGDLAGW
jgi:CBS domain containing-hemolysin-like protein